VKCWVLYASGYVDWSMSLFRQPNRQVNWAVKVVVVAILAILIVVFFRWLLAVDMGEGYVAKPAP
jgi:hypothetical protein